MSHASQLARRILLIGVALCVALVALANAASTRGPRSSNSRVLRPGQLRDGRVRLPNGWYLTPTGMQVKVGDFPLGLAVSPDERLAAVTHSGWHGKGLDLVDLVGARRVQSLALEDTWLGVAFFDGGRQLAVSAGHENRVLLYGIRDGRAALQDSIVVGPRWSAGGQYPQGKSIDYGPGAIWTTGLVADDARGRLYVVSRLDSALNVLDVAARRLRQRVPLGAVPYTCLVSRDGSHVFVSLWSSASVAVLDANSLAITRRIHVGDHPTDLAESSDGARLFVANANENSVAVLDLAEGRLSETLRTSRTPDEPAGNTPDGLALDADAHWLYVANAGADHVAVFDVAEPGRSRALGFVPVGWYPTAARVLPRSHTLVVANGKGLGSAPSTGGDRDTSAWCRYVSYSPDSRGVVSLIARPSPAMLARLTGQVFANTPPIRRPAPRSPRPPIRHVFYVIKENRSYDQVLGDLPRGNGDSTLCLFGERVSPNHHALAREWVLLDNIYCDSDGSADGHNWGMGAYATDYVIKGEPNNRIYDFEGGNPLAYPSAGYLWDLCARHGITYRSYGEFVFNGTTFDDTVRAGVPALEAHTAPHYLGYDTHYSDLDRERAWLEEFDRYDRDGGLPQLSIIRLPNDHTEGTCSGRPTPRAHVAENDLALGLMVERISHSRYWNESLILVIEDDAANGQDHVDGHRTVALAAGPWVRRAAVDHTLYTSCSVLRCIEDVFRLPPMSQFDARANGLEGIFARRPDARPYRHREANLDVNETNLAGAFGQAESDAMDFSVADRVPYEVLNRILWHSVRGAAAPPPPPVRSGFALGLGPAAPDRDD
ncbi:MAG TPA: bifunctional YncE family protein/alkaline phosphatase family protein [Candidatus Eisenbacteria bacterium]|jgi:YVTN family beta-propeller protein